MPFAVKEKKISESLCELTFSAFYSPQPPVTTSPPAASNFAFSPALTASIANEDKNFSLTPSPPPPRTPSAPSCPPPMPNDTNANDDSKNNYSNAEENDQEDITDVVTEVEKPEIEVENSQIVNENAIENQSSDDKGKTFILFAIFSCGFLNPTCFFQYEF